MATGVTSLDFEDASRQNEPSKQSDIIASLQALTSNISEGPISGDDVSKSSKTSQANAKTKPRRGRKKKIPQKPCQHPILPKMFAIQIAPQTNVLASVNTLINQTLLPSTAKVSSPLSQLPSSSVNQQSSRPVELSSTRVTSTTATTHTKSPKIKAKTVKESVALAGKFHYASHDNDPSPFQSEDVDSGGFPQQNHRRIVHNATEKRRKEKINGWISKIASVLFKYNPEQQHKIYILEKAYEFISERSGSQPEEGKSQDAFTQSASTETVSFPELVKKIAELENLVDILMKVMKKYRIPTPAIVMRSSYVESQLNSIDTDVNYAESNDLPLTSATIDSNTDYSNGPPMNQLVAEIAKQPGFHSGFDPNLDPPKQSFLEAAAGEDCLAPSKSFILVSKSQEVGPVQLLTSSISGINPVIANDLPILSANLHDVAMTDDVTKAVLQRSCTTTTQFHTNVATAEPSLTGPAILSQSGGSVDHDLQLMISVENTVFSTPQILENKKQETENKGFDDYRMLPKDDSNVQISPSLPLSFTKYKQNQTVFAVKPPIIVDKGILPESVPSNATTTAEGISLASASLPSCFINDVAISTNCTEVPLIASKTSCASLGGLNTTSTLGTRPVSDSGKSSKKVGLSKTPSMKSQMFVMKNMVQSRSKTGNVASSLEKHFATQRLDSQNCAASVSSESIPNLSSSKVLYSLPTTCLPVSATDDPSMGDKNINKDFSTVKLGNQKHSNEADYIKSVPNKFLDFAKSLSANPSVYSISNLQELNSLVQQSGQNMPKYNQTRQSMEHTSSSLCLQSRHSVSNLLSNSCNIVTENQMLSVSGILTSTSASPSLVDRSNSVTSISSFYSTNSIRPTSMTTFTTSNSHNSVSNTNVSRKRNLDINGRKDNPKVPRNSNVMNLLSPLKAPQKRLKRTATQRTAMAHKGTTPTAANSTNSLTSSSQNRSLRVTDEKRKTRKSESASHALSTIGLGSSLPRPHSVVSLARSQQCRSEENQRRSNGLSEFSAESLLRNNPVCVPQVSQTHAQNSHVTVTHDVTLPTILNIFAPASIGSMINPANSLGNLNNLQNQSTTPIVNISLPTIQSTFSNFSAEALIGGSVDTQQGVNNSLNVVQPVSDNMLVQQESQNLFTDFSADTLLAGTESSLSYGIDNIINRNESSITNSCISPNWLQNGPLIDNSPVRNSFNPGFNIFESTTGSQGHKTVTSNTNFILPGKWRPDYGKTDDSNLNNSNYSMVGNTNVSMWCPGVLAPPQKSQKNAASKQRQKNTMKVQQSNKRGPSYGDFLLVDSTS